MQSSESQLKRLEIMDKAERLFNCDESGINSHIATREKAYGVRGEQTFQEKVNMKKIATLTHQCDSLVMSLHP